MSKPWAQSRNSFGQLLAAAGLLLLAACQSPEERIASHYAAGQELLEQGDTVKAALEFKNVLQIDEDHVGALYGLSKHEQAQRNWAAVVALLRKVIDLDPTHLAAHIDHCRVMLLAGVYDRAIESCDAAEKLDGDNSEVLALQAAVYHKLEDNERAVALAERALALDPENIEASVVLAAQDLVAGDPAAALARLDAGLERDERHVGLQLFRIQVLEQLHDEAAVEAVFHKLIEFYPENRAFRLALIRYYVAKGRPEAAEAELRAVAEANPDDVQAMLNVVRFVNTAKGTDAAEQELRTLIAGGGRHVESLSLALSDLLWTNGAREEAREIAQRLTQSDDPDTAITAGLQLARMMLASNEMAAAEAEIAKVLERDQRNADALVMRAAVKSERQDYDEAINDLRAALNERPEEPAILVRLARVLELNGAIELAEERLAIAARTSEFAPVTAREYAGLLMRRGKRERAKEVLSRSLDRHPNDVANLKQMALLLLNDRDWVGAERIADRLGELESESASAQQIMGAVLSGQERFDDSISVLREAQQAAPTAVQPMVSLVRAYVQAGRRDDAMAFLEGIIATDPNRPEVHVLIGLLLNDEGKPDEAEARFRTAIDVAPESAQGYRALAAHLVNGDEPEAALEVVEAGIGRNPDNLALLFLAASVKQRLNDIDGAIEIYDHMYDLRPRSVVIANNLASLIADYRSDEASLDKAFRLAQRLRQSEVPQFKDTLGWLYHKRGDLDAAIALLSEAANSPQPLPIYYYHLALAHMANDEIEPAREALGLSLKLAEGQPFELKAEAERALEALKD